MEYDGLYSSVQNPYCYVCDDIFLYAFETMPTLF